MSHNLMYASLHLNTHMKNEKDLWNDNVLHDKILSILVDREIYRNSIVKTYTVLVVRAWH